MVIGEKLGHGEVGRPIFLLVGDIAAEELFNCTIGLLGLLLVWGWKAVESGGLI